MSRALIFGGTTEGRRIAEALAGSSAELTICVATEQGAEMLSPAPNITTRVGRLDEDAMIELIKKLAVDIVVDATHPYAVDASANISRACEKSSARYVRVVRDRSTASDDLMIRVSSLDEAISRLDEIDCAVLFTLGSKELPAIAKMRGATERAFIRALPTEQFISAARSLGFSTDRLICMQGPFSAEMNVATMRMIGAKAIVTKDTGAAGGFSEKIAAAREVGAIAIVIDRPTDESGISVEECIALLGGKNEASSSREKKNKFVSIIGVGPGSAGALTDDARRAIADASMIVGSKRLVELFSHSGCASKHAITSDEIAKMIRDASAEKIAVLMSGDVGFFSGAKKLLPLLADLSPQVIPGIPSPAALSSRIGESWDDAAIVSAHGRDARVAPIVRRSAKTIVLAGGADGVAKIVRELAEFGLGDTTVVVGEDLFSPTERIRRGSAASFTDAKSSSLSTLMVINSSPARPMPGMSDDSFIRGDIPMTKSEVRGAILSKLRVDESSICWDVGAGTGSVSVEMAIAAFRGRVFAIEREAEGIELIRANSRKHGASNVEPIEGSAPDALASLPDPTHVFVGGSGGHLEEIIDIVSERSPSARVVISAITAETFALALTKLKAIGAKDLEIVQLSVARGRSVGSSHMMTAQNPIFLLSYGGSR